MLRFLIPFLLLMSLPSASVAETRAAIIDTAFDTRPWLDRLRANGVQVIGRYYARCPQTTLPAKRLVDQGTRSDANSEINQIARRGMAILSIYQYYSNHPNKYLGQDKDGRLLPDDSCNWETARPRSVEEEARLDARAAVSQATRLGQAPGSAIYFGVDFRLDADDTQTRTNLGRYFRVISSELRAAGFRTGAYGSGLTLSLLQKEGLVDHTWIMASASFPGSSAFHRSGKWNLFQNEVNQEWFGAPKGGTSCSRGLPVDTNVQNPAQGADVGFWSPGAGKYQVPPDRTRAIFDTRRIACNGDAIVREAVTSSQTDLTSVRECKNGKLQSVGTLIPHVTSVRINLANVTSKLVQVDVNDDGTWDGWTWTGNLPRSFNEKPDYIFGTGARAAARCP